MNNNKQLSNPTSTGGLGVHFENRVQGSFVLMMLIGGFAPCLPTWPINKIKLQGKYQNFDTDDVIIYAKETDNNREAKLLGQIKHSITLTKGNKVFGEVIYAAWSDFQKESFNEELDAIALITGPLSTVETDDVRSLLRQARHSENSEDFMNRVKLGNFTSNKQREKLEVFKTHLAVANDNVALSNDQLWRFLKSFNLLIYDLDIQGVTLSLLHTLIAQYSQDSVKELWARIEQEVIYESENAGFITINNIAIDIRSAFEKPIIKNIPSKFIPLLTYSSNLEQDNYIRNRLINVPHMVIANFLGSWDENSKLDRQLIQEFTGQDYEEWASKIREISLEPNSPISVKNGVWSINERHRLWGILGRQVFDVNLEKFKECAIAVLSEKDKKFELPPAERISASIYGKELKYSQALRRGISGSLALLGSYPEVLKNCSLEKAELVVTLVIREIFQDADWKLWGSLNDLLPNISEAAPSEFLEIVENAIIQTPCPYKELFLQEGRGAFGENYIRGLLWALEGLAWEEQYLVRVSVLLGELADQDPGGHWSNRPINSLKTIFLPWLPQTTASLEKRQVAIKIICNELPELGWKLLLSIFPHRNQTSLGSHKPVWRKVTKKVEVKEVTSEEYVKQTIVYVDLAIKLALGDSNKIKQLITHFNVLPKLSLIKIIDHIMSEEILLKSEEERAIVWSELVKFLSRNRGNTNKNSAIDSEIISKVEVAARVIAPKNPFNLYQELFNSHETDFLEGNEDLEIELLKINKRRQQAIREILDYGGIDYIYQFAKNVKETREVGQALANLKESQIEHKILPEFLNINDDKIRHLASGYVWQKHYIDGWEWIDSIDMKDWIPEQIGLFFTYLPFTMETWKRVKSLLENMDSYYWKKVHVTPYQADEGINIAVKKLIENERPNAAIYCMNKVIRENQLLNKELAFRALLLASSSEEQSSSMDNYYITRIIEKLQNDPSTNKDTLLQIEWIYLPLLDREEGIAPKSLESELASNPEFFCQIISLVYRSELQPDTKSKLTERQQMIATNAYALLDEWKTPPGIQPNGSFSEEDFLDWLAVAHQKCEASGHLKIALQHIGAVLFYCPPDSRGLWIDHTVANALNKRNLENMRKGFCMKAFNSRGVFWVDPTGKQEFDLAEKYRKQAEDVENAGYQRFATAIRSLAESYDRQAKQIINEHKLELED